MTLSQQAKQIRLLLRELIHRTLCGRFVGSPPKQLGAMAETIAGDMIVADFDDEYGLKRMPDVLFALIPATGPPGSRSGEARRCDELLQLICQRWSVDRRECWK